MPILTASNPTLRLITLLPLLFLFFSSASSSLAEDRAVVRKDHSGDRRVALVIGNSSYKVNPLTNPANDATDMAKALKEAGFRVTLQVDASQRQMDEAVGEFGRLLRDGGVGLFFYAGHGIQVDGHNYLLPVDAKIESESDVRYMAVDAGRVLGKMEDAGNEFNIVILDACRNNPFARSFRDAQQGLAKLDAPAGALIAYSTSPGKVAADGEGRNSPYTQHLLRQMSQPGLKIEDVFKQVRQEVVREQGKGQVPWESSSLIGNFYFRPDGSSPAGSPTPAASAAAPASTGAQSDREALFWESIKDSNDIELYQDYLKRFPEGTFTVVARRKVAGLQGYRVHRFQRPPSLHRPRPSLPGRRQARPGRSRAPAWSLSLCRGAVFRWATPLAMVMVMVMVMKNRCTRCAWMASGWGNMR